MTLPIRLIIIPRFILKLLKTNTITDHDIKRNDVSGNSNLKHPNVLIGSDLNESFKVQSSSKSQNQSDTSSFKVD